MHRATAKKELWFWVTAVLLLIMMVGYVLFVMSFLARILNQAFVAPRDNGELIVRFDFGRVEQLFKGATVVP